MQINLKRDDLPPMAQSLIEVLAHLHSDGHTTVTRNIIKDYLGKNRLTERELIHLDYLVLLGFVEIIRPVATHTIHYRLLT